MGAYLIIDSESEICYDHSANGMPSWAYSTYAVCICVIAAGSGVPADTACLTRSRFHSLGV